LPGRSRLWRARVIVTWCLAPATTSPRCATAPTPTTATAASKAASATAASAATATATATVSPCNLHVRLGRVLFVENVELRQGHVRDLFLSENHLGRCGRGLRRRYIRRRSRCCVCSTACQRQGPGGAQHRYCLSTTSSLRSLRCLRHSTVLLSVEHIVRWAMQRNSIPAF